jgi:mRNA-degrading endonuclease RelE of RelBE toxin-antitoxin system
VSYRIAYSPDAVDHLRLLDAPSQRRIVDAIDEQLTHEPLGETRNRKPMRPNPLAPWELRVGHIRIYYEVREEPEPTVFVLAIGLKERNTIRIGGEEVNL